MSVIVTEDLILITLVVQRLVVNRKELRNAVGNSGKNNDFQISHMKISIIGACSPVHKMLIILGYGYMA